MSSQTPSLSSTHPFTLLPHPSKIISTAINNPLTFILWHLWKPSELLRLFTSPIPVSSPHLHRRFLIVGALSLLLLGLIAAGTVVLGLILLSPLIVVLSPVWVPVAVAVFFVGAGLLLVWGWGAAVAAGVAWVVQRFFSAHKVKPPCSDLKLSHGKGAAPGA